VQDDVRHLICQSLRGPVDARVVPGVDPVDHAEQAHDRRAGVELEFSLTFEIVHQAEADAIVLTLDGGDLGVETILQGFIFMRKHFKPALVGHEVFKMIQNEDADALLEIGYSLEP